jgi:hypothetical protein
MRGKAILIAAVVVLVLAGGGAAAYVATKDDDSGSGSEQLLGGEPGLPRTDTSTSTAPAPEPAAPTDSTPSSPPETDTAPAQSSSTVTDEVAPGKDTPSKGGSGPPHDFSVPPAQKFSGTGNASLGTVDVRSTAILRWRSAGHFEVRFGQSQFAIIAPTKTGQLQVPPFRFDHVRVLARGRWTIWVSPQK